MSLLLLELDFRIELAAVVFVRNRDLSPDVLVLLRKLIFDLLLDQARLLVHLPQDVDGLDHLVVPDLLRDPLQHELPLELLALLRHVVRVSRHGFDA